MPDSACTARTSLEFNLLSAACAFIGDVVLLPCPKWPPAVIALGGVAVLLLAPVLGSLTRPLTATADTGGSPEPLTLPLPY
jgi:hypothetical protein